MRKNDRFIAIFIGLGIWTLVIFQFLEPKSVTAQHEPHTLRNINIVIFHYWITFIVLLIFLA